MSDILQKVKKRLNELKVPYEYVRLSERPNKKIVIRIKGKTIHFGDKNSITHLESPNPEKMKAYIARHSKIYLKDGTRAIDREYSPSWFSLYVLWLA